MSNKIFQIHISLVGSMPKIWRRILIPADFSVQDLHKIIQTAMGWTNSHLHQFIKNGVFYSPKMDFENNMFDDDDNDEVDYENLKISDLFKTEKERIKYIYDFGDFLEHNILLEKILERDNSISYPICLAGKMNGAMEDSGGEWEDDEEELEEFQKPSYFNKKELNEQLQESNFGCVDFFGMF